MLALVRHIHCEFGCASAQAWLADNFCGDRLVSFRLRDEATILLTDSEHSRSSDAVRIVQ
ncbi:MAG: hypothetical protein DME52_08570 [Verrucomicrobia bacterium]|nr:MAG: hypothetical protein DME52_08570 [Verrucomicrobiota bacterium]PYK48343.1 MAG: hypothetical protein DME51_11680 [Verrucomicrobiota bacterium]